MSTTRRRLSAGEAAQPPATTSRVAAARRLPPLHQRNTRGRPSANSAMPHQNASGPAPYSVHARIQRRQHRHDEQPRRACAPCMPRSPRHASLSAASEQNRYITRYAEVEIRMIEREHLAPSSRCSSSASAIVTQRAGDEQRVVRACRSAIRARTASERRLRVRQHARHLALNENPAVERAEAADECEQREQARGAVAPEQAHHVRERRGRLRELRSRESAGSPPSTRRRR